MTSAAQIARAALALVYDTAVVESLRDDSPLPGYRSADAIAVATAVRVESERAGHEVALGDQEMVEIHTVGDLEDAIVRAMSGDIDE